MVRCSLLPVSSLPFHEKSVMLLKYSFIHGVYLGLVFFLVKNFRKIIAD